MGTELQNPYRQKLGTILIFVHFLVTVAGIVVGKAARDAIFLTRFTPVQMAAADLIVVAAVVGLLWALLRARRLSIFTTLLFAPICFACGDLGVWYGCLAWPGLATTLATYVWTAVQASFSAAYAALLAHRALRTLRITPHAVLGAGAVAGWIAGGAATQAVTASWGASALLPVVALLTALTPAVALMVYRSEESMAPESDLPLVSRPTQGLQQNAARIYASSHLRTLASLTFLSAAVSTIAAFQFRSAATASIHATDDLAAFFGVFNSCAGLMALAAQVSAGRVLQRLGPGADLMLAPVAIATSSVGLLLWGTLAPAVLLRGSDQIVRYSFDRAAMDRLYRVLPDREVIDGRTVIETVVGRFGDLFGTVVALVGVLVLGVSFKWLSVPLLFLVAASVTAAFMARRTYGDRLLEPLDQIPRLPGAPTTAALAVPHDPGRGFLDPDPSARLDYLRALTIQSPLVLPRDRIAQALGAEIVGLAVMLDGAAPRVGSADADRRGCDDAIERIGRLLMLTAPDRYPASIVWALRSGDARAEARAMDYLDLALPLSYRRMLLSLLDRWIAGRAACEAALTPCAVRKRPFAR